MGDWKVKGERGKEEIKAERGGKREGGGKRERLREIAGWMYGIQSLVDCSSTLVVLSQRGINRFKNNVCMF